MGRTKVEMPGIDLKYYGEYRDRIEQYAAACGIKIKYDNKDGEGSYEPHKRLIRIDPNLSDSCEIAVLLHELGHCLDNNLLTKKIDKKLSKAYTAVYRARETKKQLAIVVRCEIRAWKYARAIAKKLRIPLGKWFDDIQKYCIYDYKN